MRLALLFAFVLRASSFGVITRSTPASSARRRLQLPPSCLLSVPPPRLPIADVATEDDAAEDDAARALAVAAPAAFGLLAAAACLLAVPPPADAASVAVAAGGASAAMPAQAIFEKAAKRAIGGGISGALAGVAQVLCLMWLRTTMNYQYRNGGSARDAFATLYEEGGLRRFYRGISFAIVQTPLSRFGDTAANSGMIALLADSTLPIGVRTAFASAAAATWRIGLTPLDTMKTTLQVRGAEGYEQVASKVQAEGPSVLFQGALANAAASFVGNYPWYLTFNTLNEKLPPFGDDLPMKLLRSAVLGICAAGASDCISNSIRVLKTTRQTAETSMTYKEAAQRIIDADGWWGLFGRGLSTRLVTNALQAALFTVTWKLLEDQISTSGILG